MIDYTLPLEDLPDPLPIEPLTKPFDVTITPPGSKSITCRAYVLAALADGESKIIRPLRAEDTDLLLDALCTLGAEARWEGEDVYIKGVNGRFPRGGPVNLGDGGTPTRFMIAAACLAAEPVVVDGSKRMRERPIAEGVDMLRQLGAKIEYVEEEGRLPVRVVPSDEFKGGELTIGRTASSQFISALMLIAPFLKHPLHLVFTDRITSRGYLNLTGAVMVAWDAIVAAEVYDFARDPTSIKIRGNRERPLVLVPAPIGAQQYEVEPDASSAAYWLTATGVSLDSQLQMPGFRPQSFQPDGHVNMALRNWCITFDVNARDAVRNIGKTDVVPDCDCEGMPDGAIAIAAIAAQSSQRVRLEGLHTLRVKETDRIAALANELRKVGCEVETTDDSIAITPIAKARKERSHDDGSCPPAEPGANGPIIIETYNDHRMAMAFAVLGLARPGGHTLAIRNPACVKKSYPTFWQDFAKLYQ